MAHPLSIIEAQIRECFGRAIYAHKTHEKDGDICAATLGRLKIAQIVLSSGTACGAIALVFTNPVGLKVATAIVSLITLVVSGYMKGFDPGATAQKHRDTAAAIWVIRESYLSLLTDIHSGSISVDQARDRRDDLQRALAAIYKSAPHTTPKAYANAQVALQRAEDYTFNEGEIDRFLPPALKRTEVDIR